MNRKIYVWSSELSDLRGEGILAIEFIKLLSKKNQKEIICEGNQGKIRINFNKKVPKTPYQNTINLTFKEKYLSPFLGILKVWKYHFKGYKTAYVNFLPLWNIFIFLFLPKKTILGPITGAKVSKNYYSFQGIIRRFLFPLLYWISIRILFNKWQVSLFSTENLKCFIPNKYLSKAFFNFQLIRLISLKKVKKKKIDFLIYYRNHPNKFDKKTINLINQISKNFSVFIVGDNFNNSKVKNLGIINKKKLSYYLSNAKMTISSDENLISNFNIECLNNGVKVISRTNKKFPNFLKSYNFFKIKYYKQDFENTKIIRQINKIEKNNKAKNKNLFIDKLKKNIDYYFNNFL